MGKSTSSPPAAPDPVATANAQSAANKETAITQQRLNQVNELTPYGSSIYSPTGQTADGVATYNRTTTLAPSQQRQLNAQNALQEQLLGYAPAAATRINNAISTPFNYDGLPAAPVENDAARQQVQDALYGRAKAQLDPLYNQQQQDLETRLAQQGFAVNSAGYDKAVNNFSQNRANAYESALQDSIAGGGAEQSRLFGLDTTARNNAIQERLTQRNQPLNEYATLAGQAGQVAIPQFQSAPQTSVAPTDTTGPTNLAYQAQLNAYNQQQQQQQSGLGSLFGLAGAALGSPWLSDPALKTDLEPIDPAEFLGRVRRLKIERWRYKFAAPADRRVGPYADDWARAFGGDGHVIDPQQAFGVLLAAVQALAVKFEKLEAA